MICFYYEVFCVKRGMFNKLFKVNYYRFDGVVQVIDYQKIKVYQMVVLFFIGFSKEDFFLCIEDIFVLKQRIIFEVLKIKECDSRVIQCLGFY